MYFFVLVAVALVVAKAPFTRIKQKQTSHKQAVTVVTYPFQNMSLRSREQRSKSQSRGDGLSFLTIQIARGWRFFAIACISGQKCPSSILFIGLFAFIHDQNI